MIGRLALLLLLISLLQGPSGPTDRDGMQESKASSPSGLKIVKFSHEEKMVQEEQYELPSTQTPPAEQLPPPGRVSRKLPDNSARETRSRDLSERMRDLRQLPTAPRPPRPRLVRKYLFHAQMKNEASKTIKRFVWAYKPPSDQGQILGKDYLCNSRIEPGALQAVKVLSPIPRSRVVSASDAGQPSRELEPAITDLEIKFVEYEDGSTWQHPDWNAMSLVSRNAIRKLGKGKCTLL